MLRQFAKFTVQIIPCDSSAVTCNILLRNAFDVGEEPSDWGELLSISIWQDLAMWSKYTFEGSFCTVLIIVLGFLLDILFPAMINRCHLRDILLLTSNNVWSEYSIHFIDFYITWRNKSIQLCKFNFAEYDVIRNIFWFHRTHFRDILFHFS